MQEQVYVEIVDPNEQEVPSSSVDIPQSPGWTAPRPGERKNAYGYAVPMGTLQVVLLTAANTLVGSCAGSDEPSEDENRERAAWWSICNSLERGDRVALQRECVRLYGDLPAGPWEDA